MTEEQKIQDASIEEAEVETSEEVNEEEQIEEISPEEKNKKRIQNLVSAIILLAGLFLGSLFVDVAQMVKGGGFSERALGQTDVFAAAGKTWVAYNEPIIKLQVVSDDTCQACKPDEVLVGLKQVLPTMSNQKIDANSEEGKKLISQFNIKTLPAFIFSKEIEKTDLFAKAQPFMQKQGDFYAIKSAEAGFPIGKYLVAPEVQDKDIVLGNKDAQVKVVAFTSVLTAADKLAYQTIISQVLKDYSDKVAVVIKNYFPPTSAQAMSVALANGCANDQGKFTAFADKAYANQTALSQAKDANSLMKAYAVQAGLNAADFGKCMDAKTYQSVANQDIQDGQELGLQSTPSIFVGNDLQQPTAKYDDVKKAIDEQLAK